VKPVLFSGIQPSGDIHIGNYCGAIRNWVRLLDTYEAIFCIVDYHTLTQPYDRDLLAKRTFDAALTNIAAGLDPARCRIFVQSHVPQHTELAWVFSTVTPMGDLSRMTQFKEKAQRAETESYINAGLFTYPVLQAADILLYKAVAVPVGEDQVQHIELTRDMAGFFNSTYGETFRLPEPMVEEATAKVPGTDGQKMSKSYGNTIGIFDEGKQLKSRVMGIVTDSQPVEAPKDPEPNTVYQLYKLVAEPEEAAEMADRFRAGGYGYGEAKKRLLAAVDAYFAPFRDRRKQLEADRDYVEDVLRTGATRARAEARTVLNRARAACGID